MQTRQIMVRCVIGAYRWTFRALQRPFGAVSAIVDLSAQCYFVFINFYRTLQDLLTSTVV